MGTHPREPRHAREPVLHAERKPRERRSGRQIPSAWPLSSESAEVVREVPRRARANDFVQSAQAFDIISRFCEDHPVTRVEPNKRELAALWDSCSLLEQSDVVAALYGQLAGAINSHDWQPRLRALAIIEHFYRDEASRLLAQKVASRAGELLRHLSLEVPECQDAACRVLTLRQLAEVLPSGQEVHMANEGGLLYFVAETCEKTVEALPIGATVEAHSLTTVRLNGARGKVTGLEGERVKVKFSEGEKALKPSNLKLVQEDDLILLPDRSRGDLVELCGDSRFSAWPPCQHLCDSITSPVDDLLSLAADAPVDTVACTALLPEDLNFSEPLEVFHIAERLPEVFNISDGDCSYEATSNAELNRMFSFAPRQTPVIPFLGAGRDCIPLAVGQDPFASVVADAYRLCVKAG